MKNHKKLCIILFVILNINQLETRDITVIENQKINKSSMSDQIYKIIAENISSGKWKAGDKLPSEAELAESFGVNRLTVRGALQKLNAMGVIETRTGSGSFVVDFNFEDYIRAASVFYINSNLMEDLINFRMTMEIECVRLAAKLATEEELRELERLAHEHTRVYMSYTEYDHPVDEEWIRATASSDLAFHEQIYKMTHNQYYIYTFAMIHDALYDYMLLCASKWKPDHFKKYEHRDIHYFIYESIRDKDVTRCMKEYKTMLLSYSTSDGSMPRIED